jgi:hypothetical protein
MSGSLEDARRSVVLGKHPEYGDVFGSSQGLTTFSTLQEASSQAILDSDF